MKLSKDVAADVSRGSGAGWGVRGNDGDERLRLADMNILGVMVVDFGIDVDLNAYYL